MSWWEQGAPLQLVVALNHHAASLAALVKAFHFAGQGLFYLLVIGPLYWAYSPRLGRRLVTRLMLSAWANAFAKNLFGRPRPFQMAEAIRPLVTEGAPGLPSGHSQNAVAVWGSLARWCRRAPLSWAVVVFCFLMGLSRLVAGVHYPQDVLVGWLLGGLVVVGCERAEARWLPAIRAAGVRRQMVWAALGALLTAALTRLVALRRPEVVSECASPLGMMLGLLFGMAWERAWVRFAPAEAVWRRVLAALVGVAGMAGLYAGLTQHHQPVAARLAAHVVIGAWVTCGAPWLLLRLGLGRAEAVERSEP